VIRSAGQLAAFRADHSLLMREAGMMPDPWQSQFIRSDSSRIILRCPRQSGKSESTACRHAARMLFRAPHFVLMFAPTRRQSVELFSALKRLLSPFSQVISWTEETQHSIRLENGSRAIALPATESTIRGFSKVSAVVVDEAAMTPRKLYRAVRPMLAMSRGEIDLLSTPKGKAGFFWETWQRAEAGERWTPYSVTWKDVARYDPDFIEEEREEHGPEWFAQEYECQFLEDPADRRNPTVIPSAAIDAMFQ
jgi:hypothetical protein